MGNAGSHKDLWSIVCGL